MPKASGALGCIPAGRYFFIIFGNLGGLTLRLSACVFVSALGDRDSHADEFTHTRNRRDRVAWPLFSYLLHVDSDASLGSLDFFRIARLWYGFGVRSNLTICCFFVSSEC